MRQRLTIIITLIVVIVVLIALNAASYVRVEHESDSESSPDRSTYNSGATGTRALYDFLHESNYQVVRWREAPSDLLSFSGSKPATFVIVGEPKVAPTQLECREILRWVRSGGRLVLIDRHPKRDLLPESGDWWITAKASTYPWPEPDPTDFSQMTAGVKPVPPTQPTALTLGVDSVMPSRFAAAADVAFRPRQKDVPEVISEDQATGGETEDTSDDPDFLEVEPSPEEEPTPEELTTTGEESNASPAPVVHLSQAHGSLLVDYPHGKGRIVVLLDPFIAANNGVGRADNLLLAVNVVAGGGGLIAFDEFHQGRATTQNALFQYFSGTPVMAICAQLALIGLAVIWSRGRRFGRPLPLPVVDRRSKLEFVASMAELQQRARAHDLALENIYGRVRRVLVRHAGLSNSSPRAEIAKRVAKRSGIPPQELEALMKSCEDTINGAPTNARESLQMARRLREIESALGLRMRSRDLKQVSEKS